MNTAKSIAALMLVIASSSALAEGGSDRLHGKMIQANEQAMRATPLPMEKNHLK
jgi:hypothetical protein